MLVLIQIELQIKILTTLIIFLLVNTFHYYICDGVTNYHAVADAGTCQAPDMYVAHTGQRSNNS